MRSSTRLLALAAFAALLGFPSRVSAAGKWFDNLFVIIMENTDLSTATGLSYMGKLTKRPDARLYTNYQCVARPSQPNYIGMVYGSTFGVTDDNYVDVTGANLFDLLEAKGISWKLYAENWPGDCSDKETTGIYAYARKHNPAIIMNSVRTNATRCAKIVHADQLAADLASPATFPSVAFYIPNQWNDGHNFGIGVGDIWMSSFIPKTLPSLPASTLTLITFDEPGKNSADTTPIYTLAIGAKVKAGTDAAAYNHYSFLKTVEENWALGNVGRGDVTAVPLAGLA
ncbi:hypothetical protein M427DRAFT_32687 [Gonapodya prolifera JEL478]|uniref:Phosphoesterase-domain-containing protein n=1 Tax=Gonapodya prolifera (strain JEL478) TaxID=1344416 RepID=A0A139AEW5_GONPJ|nr:hypothetical protein M427DRAFT_32687 [Gonapodya prolifera JEL478]|eukprot:KXS14963.1 hypothetical protein M427DRAFT_32687 [Gonapodya prolifera JEL478]